MNSGAIQNRILSSSGFFYLELGLRDLKVDGSERGFFLLKKPNENDLRGFFLYSMHQDIHLNLRN